MAFFKVINGKKTLIAETNRINKVTVGPGLSVTENEREVDINLEIGTPEFQANFKKGDTLDWMMPIAKFDNVSASQEMGFYIDLSDCEDISLVNEFNSIAAFKEWFDVQPTNSINNPYKVSVNIDSLLKPGSPLFASSIIDGTIGNVLYTNENKYIDLDLSKSTFKIVYEAVFSECKYLTSVIFPNSVTEFYPNVFVGCNSLKSFNFPENTKIIGSNCCTKSFLEIVTIPATVTNIKMHAFLYSTSLKLIICHAINPPQLDLSIRHPFENVHPEYIIKVPAESVEAYKIDKTWINSKDRIFAI